VPFSPESFAVSIFPGITAAVPSASGGRLLPRSLYLRHYAAATAHRAPARRLAVR